MKKKYILIPLSVIILLGICYGVLFYFNFFQGFVYVKNNHISSSAIPKDRFISNYKPSTTFEDSIVSNVNDLSVDILGETLNPNTEILLKSQRYYLPLNIIATQFGFDFNKDDISISLTQGSNTYIFTDTLCTINGTSYNLRGNLLVKDDIEYLALSDIEYIFNVISVFNFSNNSVALVKNTVTEPTISNIDTEEKIALIRLEDFSAGDSMFIDAYQAKMKALGNLMYTNGIKYHIAWVPRFKAPSEDVDNDLLTNNCIQNVGFVNLLDYMINKGGEVGLHGYTHQSEDQRSLNGTELSSKYNSSPEETRAVIENSINTATALNIPYSFFESPHYKASSKQKKVIEEYFEYLYEPFNPLVYHKLKKTDNNNLYIPTPLSYVRDLNADNIIKGLENPTPGLLASLFYHPTKELDFIEVDTSNNTFNVSYSEESPLQQIIKGINDNNYVTVHVSDLKN